MAFCDVRWIIAKDISSTFAERPVGLVSSSFLISDSFSSSVRPAYLYRFVFMNDDETQLIRTPNLANSIAEDLVNI